MKNLAAKRVFDLIFSSILIAGLSPVFLVLVLLIKVFSPGPVLYNQPRLGRFGRTFSLYKFRTMIPNADKLGSGMYLEENDTRVTRLGRWLRKTSFDELPQLFNVVKGEMSLVGPRPAPLHHLELYDVRQRQRLLLLPGITGWAQVNGRNAVLWPQRIEHDLWYLEHCSFWLDLKILFLTAARVFRRQGIEADPDRRITDPFNKGF